MAVYYHHRTYRSDLDVRDWADLAKEVSCSEPNGDFWPIVGGRRSGKTWALHGLRERLGESRAEVLDLRKAKLDPPRYAEGHVLLLDEPGVLLERPDGARQLLGTLAELRRRGVWCVAALTPREWQQLRGADDGQRVDAKDLQHGLHPLSPDQARRMARTPEALALFPKLEAEHPDWCRSPYLLEMAFHVAEGHRTWGEPRETIRIALETCEGHQVRYASFVYLDGLTAEQRDVLRQVAAGQDVSDTGAPHETVRIAVVHHPLSPLPYTSVERYGGLINAGVVKDRLLQGRFCLALHGHMHMGWFGEERWPGRHGDWVLRIASAPSLGSREAQERPGFNEIEIVPDLVAGVTRGDLGRRVEVTVRRRVYQGADWPVEAEMGPFEPGR